MLNADPTKVCVVYGDVCCFLGIQTSGQGGGAEGSVGQGVEG